MAIVGHPPRPLTSVGYRAHFFDFDHTLFDSDASEALAFDHALTVNGAEPTARTFASYKDINSGLWRQVEAGQIGPDKVRTLRFRLLVEQLRLDLDPVDLADAFTFGMQEFGELYPEALAVLSEVSERGPTALVTNAISEIQRRRIERVGIADLFDVIVISSEVGVAKPTPEIFNHAFAGLGPIETTDTVMIGDSLTSDIAGGRAAGLATCWFNGHQVPRPQAAAPDHEIHTLGQLLDL